MALIPFDDRDVRLAEWRDAAGWMRKPTFQQLHYASLVFMAAAYSGTIFKGREHTERLRNSCTIMDFDIMTDDG